MTTTNILIYTRQNIDNIPKGLDACRLIYQGESPTIPKKGDIIQISPEFGLEEVYQITIDLKTQTISVFINSEDIGNKYKALTLSIPTKKVSI